MDNPVALEFPSVETARARHADPDPDYRPFIRLRESGPDLELVPAEGLARPWPTWAAGLTALCRRGATPTGPARA